MASAAFSAAARRAAPLFVPAAACTAATYSTYTTTDSNLDLATNASYTHCEAANNGNSTSTGNKFGIGSTQTSSGTSSTILRKRMTSIGRFSMKSETSTNLSIPTFFIALSGKGNPPAATKDATGKDAGMTASEFESTWIQKQMPSRHPRFHSRVSSDDDRYFEYETEGSGSSESESSTAAKSNEENERGKKRSSSKSSDDGDDPKAELHRHVRETVHPGSGAYRSDLRKRIERLLTEPIDLTEKLWEVSVSSGALGSSGAVSRLKADNLRREKEGDRGDEVEAGLAKSRGGDSEADEEEVESLLLFRAHHTLADGVSLISALGDLVDEADEIRSTIKAELVKRRKRSRQRGFLRRLLRSLGRLVWFCFGSIKAMAYQTYLLWTTPQNPFEEVLLGLDPNSTLGNKSPGRSISWCDAAPLEEVKAIARDVGPKVTVNDVFVSCVAAAVARQLEEHRERLSVGGSSIISRRRKRKHQSSINVVVPVHLMGGLILPGKSVGNNIGAFVARVPADVRGESEDAKEPHLSASDRLRQVHSSLDTAKKSPAPILSYLAARFASDYLPEGLAKRLFRNANANAAVAVSNSRGYPGKVHINGRAVESSAGFLPLPPGIPVGIVVASYAGVVSLTVTAETWAVPDGDRFIGWMLDEYRRLCEECVEQVKVSGKK